MSELARLRRIPALAGSKESLSAFDILTIRLPCTSHVDVAHHGCGEIAVHFFDPTPELLAAVHTATAGACRDGKCPCFMAGEESPREAR